MKEILGCLKPYRRQVIVAILLMMLDVFCEVIQPTLMADIIGERGIGAGNIPYILKIGALMIAVAIVGLIAGCSNAGVSAKAGMGFSANLREKLFAKVQTFSFRNIDRFSTASLSTRLTNDITQLQNVVTMGMRMMIRAPLMLPFALIMAIGINAQLALILGVAIPVLLVLLVLLVWRALPLFRKMQQSVDYLNRTVQENVTNMRVVKSFVRETREKEKFEQASARQMKASMDAMYAIVLNMPLMMFVMNATIVAVVFFGGRQIVFGTLTVAEMSKFINYIMQILFSLMMFAMMFMVLSRASASYQRIREVLDTQPDLESAPQAVSAKNLRGHIAFHDVSFRYNTEDSGEPVLSHINLTIEPGQMTAIIGGTGAGKTSLISLIPRLYDVTEGAILLDGRDVRDYRLETLHEEISVVLQNNTLFSGTIADNLRWGDPNATEHDLVRAAKAAQAHEFISSFPKGYDTWIEQGGVNVSGGQKQRLCIARALLRHPKILILDDSTSAVDTATEQRLRAAFREQLADTTILLIAQRISSVRDADQIIVMDDGQIVGKGTHEELLASCTAYHEIYQSQQKEEDSACPAL